MSLFIDVWLIVSKLAFIVWSVIGVISGGKFGFAEFPSKY